MSGYDLRHHGDAEASPGLLDFAVNVRVPAPPSWLRDALVDALDHLGRYPDANAATAAVAARHGRPVEEVLPTAGAAEAFVLFARALQPRRAVCIHPSFTEPESALRAAGYDVQRVVLPAPYDLRPELVPDDADLVVLGNPTNPTGVLHESDVLLRLARPGRVLVVDEAFIDTIPGEAGSVADRRDVPGLVVVRSLTKTWGLAGLRVGYLLASSLLVKTLAAAQPLWSLSTLSLAALEACSAPSALAEADAAARALAQQRDHLVRGLTERGVEVVAPSRSGFVLVRVRDGRAVHGRLRDAGIAVRRADTFPGLGPDHLRIAVRSPDLTDALLRALDDATASVAVAEVPAVGELAHGPRDSTATEPGTGRVVLVGGGPGDPDLITVRGLRELLDADVVVTDRLGPTALLTTLPAGVEVVDVGKNPRGPGTPQDAINALLVARAKAGQRVVRLKGGDSYVFGRGAEEVQACVDAGLGVHVVPGVSSVTAAPGLAGIPLTHRGLAQHFVVVSGHLPPGDSRSGVDWAAVALAGGTLVLLMAVEHRAAIAAALIAGGKDPMTPVAVVEDASTATQSVAVTTLAALGAQQVRPPAVFVVGAVVALAASGAES